MPFKHNQRFRKHIRKEKYKILNWPSYNIALKNRANLEIWLSSDIAKWWYEQDRVYDGNGAPNTYSKQAIINCYELKLLFKLPLRQTQGFIDSLFTLMKVKLKYPDYTRISRRLANLGLNKPYYRNTNENQEVVAIAIDSTGLKRFGRDEWHQEKHRISANRSWRKLHIITDNNNFIQACDLTDKYQSDISIVSPMLEQIDISNITHATADGAYDSNTVYELISERYPKARIVIPPNKMVKERRNNHSQRNNNIREINQYGRMKWQKINNYGNRNKSETGIKRYKVIIGNKLHSRVLESQKNEIIIGCSILNKMTSLGMPISQKLS
jgi:hypothetical protein